MAESCIWQQFRVWVERESSEVREARHRVSPVSGPFSVGSTVRWPGQTAGVPRGCSLW